MKIGCCVFLKNSYNFYSRYAIAADGLDQLKVLLGNSLPQDLRDFDNFLTISFRYFASTMNLFKDSMWLDQYEDGTHQLNTKGYLEKCASTTTTSLQKPGPHLKIV